MVEVKGPPPLLVLAAGCYHRRMQTLSPQELHRLRQEGQARDLIDVRTPAEFAQSHVEGARLVPLHRLDPRQLVEGRSGSDPIYMMCGSGTRSGEACNKLQEAGFLNVYNLEGGSQAWQRAGLPVVLGQGEAMAMERQVRIAAGSLVLAGISLGSQLHPVFYGLSALVGAGLVYSGLSNTCGMGVVLMKMPWNR